MNVEVAPKKTEEQPYLINNKKRHSKQVLDRNKIHKERINKISSNLVPKIAYLSTCNQSRKNQERNIIESRENKLLYQIEIHQKKFKVVLA